MGTKIWTFLRLLKRPPYNDKIHDCHVQFRHDPTLETGVFTTTDVNDPEFKEFASHLLSLNLTQAKDLNPFVELLEIRDRRYDWKIQYVIQYTDELAKVPASKTPFTIVANFILVHGKPIGRITALKNQHVLLKNEWSINGLGIGVKEKNEYVFLEKELTCQ